MRSAYRRFSIQPSKSRSAVFQTNASLSRAGANAGPGRFVDVLPLLTEKHLPQARHANPLTQLPGNVPIQQGLKRLLEQRHAALVCYADIDSFIKPFNELKGGTCEK